MVPWYPPHASEAPSCPREREIEMLTHFTNVAGKDEPVVGVPAQPLECPPVGGITQMQVAYGVEPNIGAILSKATVANLSGGSHCQHLIASGFPRTTTVPV